MMFARALIAVFLLAVTLNGNPAASFAGVGETSSFEIASAKVHSSTSTPEFQAKRCHECPQGTSGSNTCPSETTAVLGKLEQADGRQSAIVVQPCDPHRLAAYLPFITGPPRTA